MPVTGLYIARRVHCSAIPYIKAYGQYVLDDVEPFFANLPKKSNAIAVAEFKRLGEQYAENDCDDDISVAAESAQDKSQSFYNTMVSIHQTSLNLFAAGLFHLLEQQLADLCRDGAFETPCPNDTKIGIISVWYSHNFNLDLSSLTSWAKIEELRLLANAVKHGEGGSARKLRASRPDIFQNPSLREFLPEFPKMYASQTVHLAMAGQDIFITALIFAEFSQAANSFVAEIAEYFVAHKEDHYFVGS